jgi:hypothetical protein
MIGIFKTNDITKRPLVSQPIPCGGAQMSVDDLHDFKKGIMHLIVNILLI